MPEPTAHLLKSLHSYCKVTAVASAALGCLVLIGWALQIEFLLSIFPGLVTMKANTALCLGLSGISLWLLLPEKLPALRARIAHALALFVALVGSITLSEYVFGWDLRIDQILFLDLKGSFGTSAPGRMAPMTAIAFVAMGLALLSLDRKTQRGHRPSQVLSLLAALTAMMAIVGYIYHATELYRILLYTQMAMHTAIALLLLSIAIFFARPSGGIAGDLTGQGSGSIMARRFLPAVFTIPILLGWIRLQGQFAGWYGTELGLAMFATSNILVFAVLVWLSARKMNVEYDQRYIAELQIRELNSDLEGRVAERTKTLKQQTSVLAEQAALLDLTQDSIFVRDMEDRITFWNQGAAEMYGWPEEQALGRASHELLNTQFPFPVAQIEAELLVHDHWEGELSHKRSDGLTIAVASRWALQRDVLGIPRAILEINNDITERNEAETKLRSLSGRLSLATAAGKIGVWEWDPVTNLVLCNRTMTEIYGFSPVLATPDQTWSAPERYERFAASIHPEDLPRVEATLRRVIAEKSRGSEEYRITLPGGSTRIISAVERAVLDENGNVTRLIGVNVDVTERRQAEDALRLSEERLSLLVHGVKDYAIFMLDPTGVVSTWNDGAAHIKGFKAEEIIGKHFSCFYTPEAIEEGIPARELKNATEFGRSEEEGWRVRKDGSRFWANVVVTSLRDQTGQLRGFGKVTRDITERKQAQDALFAEKERAEVTLNCIGDAVICTDVSGNISFLNAVAQQMTGWLLHEVTGRPMNQAFRILDATTRAAISHPMEMAVGQDRIVHLPMNCILIRRDGFEIPIEDSVAPIHDGQGMVIGSVIVFRDVSAARALTIQMTHSAEHDFLTGLPNRMLLNDRITQAIVFANRHEKKVAILFLDLDGFKHINDSLGHPIGDKLLQSVSKRLVNCVRGADTVSRQGGDEFVVLLSEVEHAEDAAITARRMLQAVSEPHSINLHDLYVTTSIGASVYPDDGLNAETLVKNADTAMYQAKENGRQSYQFFKPAMNVRAVERQSIEENLRRALERHEFVLYYQPKVNLKTWQITGAEALLRWIHPSRGLVPPADFIPVAEDCGLILPIGQWVLGEACRQARAWSDAGLSQSTMAVNISAMEFRDENFLPGIFSILEETGLDPKFLELELTESVLMKRAETAASVLHSLRNRGVQISVDDFGTGYSSLSYLRKFPIDALKIDQSFIHQITAAPNDTTIITAVIGMGRSMNLRVVAEGVETTEELAFLQAHQCEEAQGYYFGRPMLAKEFAKLLQCGMPEPVYR